jgi:hypothetical protein
VKCVIAHNWRVRLLRAPATAIPLLSGAVNLAALIYSYFALRPGTPGGGPLLERMDYIAQHAWLWGFGWLLWMAGTLSLLATLYLLAEAIPTEYRVSVRGAVLLAAVGAACDLAGDAVQIALPTLAEAIHGRSPALSADAGAAEWLAALLSGGVGNTLYALAGLLLTRALARSPLADRWLIRVSWAEWVLTLVATTALLNLQVLPYLIAAVIFLYAIWTVLVARYLARTPVPLAV